MDIYTIYLQCILFGIFKTVWYRGEEQVDARRFHTPEVAGSSPAAATRTKESLSMENEKIISAILEKVGNTDVSSQTVSQLVQLNPLAEGAEPDEAYFEKMASVVKSVQGNINHVASTKLEAQVAQKVEEYKRTLKSESKPVEPLKNNGGNNELDDIKKELASLRAAQSEYLTREKRQATSKAIREGLKEKFSQSGMEVRDFFIDTAVGKLSIPDGKADVAALVTEAEKYVIRDMKAAGIDTDGPTLSNTSNGNGKSWLDKKFAQKAKREGYAKQVNS